MSKTSELQNKINELEKDVAAMVAMRDKMRGDMEESYATGEDTTKVQGAIGDIERDLATNVDLLRRLDERLVRTSQVENYGECERLRKEAESKFHKAKAELLKATRPLEQAAQKHVPNVNGLMRQVKEGLATALWHNINEDFSARYVTEVPALVRTVPKRDADGVRQ